MMKKNIVLMACTAILCLTAMGCSKKEKINGYTIDELKEKDAVMFTAVNSNWGMVCADEDYWSQDSYTIDYDGTIHVKVNYNLSGDVVDESTELSKEDYDTIIHYLNDEFKGNKYIEPGACDGEGWKFSYYDLDGKLLEEYNGYTYDLEPLEKLEDIMKKYRPEQ